MLVCVNGIPKHVGATPPQSVVVPSRQAAMAAWTLLKKRLKEDEAVTTLDKYLLTRG